MKFLLEKWGLCLQMSEKNSLIQAEYEILKTELTV